MKGRTAAAAVEKMDEDLDEEEEEKEEEKEEEEEEEKEELLNGAKQGQIMRLKATRSEGAKVTVTQREAPDGGWGWCVVLAGTVNMMILGTQGPCFGVLYGRRLLELGAPPSLATWLFNIQSLIWNLSGPWAAPLNEVFTYRTIATTGALLAVSSLFLSPLVQNPYLLLLTFSTTVGVGGGVAMMSCFHSTARFFNKRLGFANGIMVTGGSLGLILMPQLASLLQDAYPFLWASFITGAVLLHCPAMNLLHHPISWHTRAPQQSPKDTVVSPKTYEDANHAIEKQKPLRQGLLRGSSVPADLLKLGGSLRFDAGVTKRLRSGSECHPDTHWLEQRGSVYRLGGSTLMAGSVLTLQDNEVTEESQQETEKNLSSLRRIWIKFRSQYNLRLMKDPLAMGLALVTCLTITGGINIFAAMPFVLAEADYTLQDTATAMSVTAVVDLFTRMLGAFITDYPKVDIRLLYVFAQLIYIVVPYGQLRDVTGSFFATVLFMSSVVFVGLLLLIFTTFTAHCCRPATPTSSPDPQRPRV